jgi:hypothetical protein
VRDSNPQGPLLAGVKMKKAGSSGLQRGALGAFGQIQCLSRGV